MLLNREHQLSLFITKANKESMVNISELKTDMVNLTWHEKSVGMLPVYIVSVSTIVLVNLTSMIYLLKKEKTLVNKLLIVDCGANLVITSVNLLMHFFVPESEVLCSITTTLYAG